MPKFLHGFPPFYLVFFLRDNLALGRKENDGDRREVSARAGILGNTTSEYHTRIRCWGPELYNGWQTVPSGFIAPYGVCRVVLCGNL